MDLSYLAIAFLVVLALFRLRRWFAGGVCRERKDLSGKIVLITGASAGIGRETARILASMGNPRVILATRNQEKTQAVIDAIKQHTGNVNVEQIRIELDDLESVSKCAQNLIASNSIPDILILNAGVMHRKRTETKQGFEASFGVNYLGHFQFTRLLLPHIVRKARATGQVARIIALSSNTHIAANMNWDDLQMVSPGRYHLWRAYPQSKLAVLLWTRFLARKISQWNCQEHVTINCVHPGIIDTAMAKEAGPGEMLQLLSSLVLSYFGKSEYGGAQTSIWAAVTKTLEKRSGFYLADCDIASTWRLKEGDEVRLWNHTCQLLKLDQDESWEK